MTPPKETNRDLVAYSKEMEIYELPDKEFKIIILKELNDMQENIARQLDEIKKIIHE